MRGLRADAKPVDMGEAVSLYESGKTLREVVERFGIHHPNLIARFRRHGITRRTKSEALKGNPKMCKPKGDKAYNWKGGYSVDTQGYLINNRTKVRRHREIVEQVLGRPLKQGEVVHHIDGDKLNNTKSNLLVCANEYHSWLEAKLVGFMIGTNKQYVS